MSAYTLDSVMSELASHAHATTKATHLRHGAVEPLFGVKVGDLKPIAKKLRGQQDLAAELYATKNSDAQYLAGLIADGSKMTKKQLDQWANGATWHMIAGCSVAWVASEHPDAFSLASKWIHSKKELVAVAGWSTLAALSAIIPDEDLPVDAYRLLLERCVEQISTAPNRVRQTMNSFIISVGTYIAPLAKRAIQSARQVGVVEVDVGDTDCKIPDAETYILKCRRGESIAPKRKTVRC